MSDMPKTTEETPVATTEPTTAPTATSEIKDAAMAVPETENTAAAPHPSEATTTIVGGQPTVIPGKEVRDEAVTTGEGTGTGTTSSLTEGILGYKAPGLLKSLRFTKHQFWFGDEALKPEALNSYIQSEKSQAIAHHNASWAQESGKGVLYYSKRAEDKATPAGLIMLSDATNVAKEGPNDFSFKTGSHVHKFQAPTTQERENWVAAIEAKIEEAKGMKDGIMGSDGYKKNMENYSKSPALVGAGATTVPKTQDHHGEEAAAGTAAAVGAGAVAANHVEKKHEETPVEQKKDTATAKSRSQSRKRNSIFGSLLGKKDDKDEVKKEEKAEEKAEKKHEKEVAKEQKAEEKAEEKAEKKQVKEEKKEEAKAAHEHGKPTETAEAAAVAAVPAVAVAAEKKHEKDEPKVNGTVTADKKSKRGSVFGGLFGKKDATDPMAKPTEKDVAPVVPAKDTEVPPVAATAPKINEPIENKPIDTAAVTAPVDTVATPAATEEAVHEPTATTTETTSPTTAGKTDKKGGLMGFIKKQEVKSEAKKEDKTAEKVAADPTAAAAVENSTAETPAATTDDRTTREKRRTSLFNNLGTQKKKTGVVESNADGAAATEVKREKSPLPERMASLFRKPSKAVKSSDKNTSTTGSEAATVPAAESTATTTATNGTTTAGEPVEGTGLPSNMEGTVHDAVTAKPTNEVSATA